MPNTAIIRRSTQNQLEQIFHIQIRLMERTMAVMKTSFVRDKAIIWIKR